MVIVYYRVIELKVQTNVIDGHCLHGSIVN